jgi:hypothetical protein
VVYPESVTFIVNNGMPINDSWIKCVVAYSMDLPLFVEIIGQYQNCGSNKAAKLSE